MINHNIAYNTDNSVEWVKDGFYNPEEVLICLNNVNLTYEKDKTTKLLIDFMNIQRVENFNNHFDIKTLNESLVL